MAAEELDPGACGMHRHLMAFDGITHELEVCRQTPSGQVRLEAGALGEGNGVVPLAMPDEERSIRQSLELVRDVVGRQRRHPSRMQHRGILVEDPERWIERARQ